MKNRMKLSKRIKLWFYWRKKIKGIMTADYIDGPGYYGIYSEKKLKMKSGLTGLYLCYDHENYRDPDDMVKWSKWNLIGYDGFKKIKDCTFSEFLRIYYTGVEKTQDS